MKVEIFSDIACPFCFIGARRFAEALDRIEDRDGIEVTWRSFQLDPGAPRRTEGDLLDHLSRKFGVTRDEARAMNESVIAMGAESGIEFDFESAFAANTFDAHRMMKLAARDGSEARLADRLFDAYFTGSSDISEPAQLVALADASGIDPDRAGQVARSDEFAAEVRADQEVAGLLGITGVPAFVFDRTSALSGAQPVEVMESAIRRALAA